jgi:hypothetical protein
MKMRYNGQEGWLRPTGITGWFWFITTPQGPVLLLPADQLQTVQP